MRHLKHLDLGVDIRPARDIGRRAELVMLPIERLVVDDRYQRPITPAGKRNILQILECFDWRKFAPLIVTRVEDGKYAIIDGQHRATAAMMHPDVDMVPCMVIEANDVATAASCFAAINGRVTAMTLGQIWFARLASGEQWAQQVQAVMDAAGVTVLKAKGQTEAYKPGETLAIGSIEQALRAHHAKIVTVALEGITRTRGGNAGMLRSVVIKAMVSIVAGPPSLVHRRDDLLLAMEDVSLAGMVATASIEATKKRVSQLDIFTGMLRQRLAEILAQGAREAAE